MAENLYRWNGDELVPVSAVNRMILGSSYWLPAADMKIGSYDIAGFGAIAAVYNGKIYTTNGQCYNNTGTKMKKYDPVNDVWEIVGDTGRNTYKAMGAVVNGKLYIIGGRYSLSGLTVDPSVYEYNLETGACSFKTNMPTKLALGVAEAINGKIYCIGGSNESISISASVQEYDPINNTWDTNKTAMPAARNMASSAVCNDKIYVFGGTNYLGQITDSVYRYDPLTDSWDIPTTMPYASSYLMSTVYGDDIYILGGTKLVSPGNELSHECYLYNSVNNTWRKLASTTHQRGGSGFVRLANKLYVFGGSDYNGKYIYSSMESLDI